MQERTVCLFGPRTSIIMINTSLYACELHVLFHSMNTSMYWVNKQSFLSLLYCITARFSSSMIDFSTIIKKIYWNRKFHSHYMWIIWSTIFLKPIFHLWRNLSSFENTLITSLTSQGFIWNFFHSSFYQIDKRHTQTPCKILLLP
jgi:hypothetical protein